MDKSLTDIEKEIICILAVPFFTNLKKNTLKIFSNNSIIQ